MTRIFLEILNSRVKLPSFAISKLLLIYNLLFRILRFRKLWSPEEVRRLDEIISSTRRHELIPAPNVSWGTLTINIVATEKDLTLLNQVIEFAIDALPNFRVSTVQVVVPGEQTHKFRIEIKKTSFRSDVVVLNEEEILPYESGRDLFRSKFSGREKWCYQQFLKLSSVLKSNTQYSLVVDCDTLLLNPRAWLNDEARTRVMPTLEFEPQYEEVLHRLGLRDFDKRWSFVPHHMLYEVNQLKQILTRLGISDLEELAFKVEQFSEKGHPSPFCIDYSLYGHSIYSTSSKRELIRWANLEVPRRFAQFFSRDSIHTKLVSSMFNSISFHSWK